MVKKAKEYFDCFYLSLMLINSLLKKDEIYYQQLFLGI